MATNTLSFLQGLNINLGNLPQENSNNIYRTTDSGIIYKEDHKWSNDNFFYTKDEIDNIVDDLKTDINNLTTTVNNMGELVNLLANILLPPEYVTDGLVQHYDAIERGDNPLVWKDLVGTNDGTITNGIWLDKSLQFNGDARVSFQGNITQDYTIMMVAKRYDIQGAHPRLIGELSNNTAYPAYYIRTNNYNYGIYAHGADIDFTPVRSMPADIFVHLTWRYNSSTGNVDLFENGIRISSRAVTVDATSSTTAFLGGNNTTTRYFNGEICNYMVYDRALELHEIDKNFKTDWVRFLIF